LIVASRLCRSAYAAFDRGGGLSRSGRWHEQGRRIVYAAESEALAALEVLVHLSSFTQIPDYVCVKAGIPEKLILDVRDFGSLPVDWASPEPEHARNWAHTHSGVESKTSAVLRVPSVVIPRESNFMLNPEHPDFKSITVDLPLPFEFDVRLIHRLQ